MDNLRRADLVSLFDIDFKQDELTKTDLLRFDQIAERKGALLDKFSRFRSEELQVLRLPEP